MDSCGGGGARPQKQNETRWHQPRRGACARTAVPCVQDCGWYRGAGGPRNGGGTHLRGQERGAEEVDWTRRPAAERHQRPGHPFWCCATGPKRPCRDGTSAHLPSKDERNGSLSTRGDQHSVIFDTGQRGQGIITYDTFPFNRKNSGIYNLPLNSADAHASANGKLKLMLQRMRR